MTRSIRSRSGRALDELSLDALRSGAIHADDLSIGREQLEAQADAAKAAGHRQLADNLRRAAELTCLPNERVLEIYELLRPGRASYDELMSLAQQLASEKLPRVAEFIAEAAEAYRARGVARSD